MKSIKLDEKILPSIEDIRRTAKSLAMLDAILSPEWEYRYFSYNCVWSEKEEMASMRDGCGNDWFMLFNSVGAALKGFFHESKFANDNLFSAQLKQSVPSEFSAFLNEPAFSIDDATFCYWRRSNDNFWSKVYHPSSDILNCDDGSVKLMSLLVGQPSDYRRWALGYYEVSKLPLKIILSVFQHTPLNQSLVLSLNPDSSFEDVLIDAKEIGYPVASS
jgi:hypothetical protein